MNPPDDRPTNWLKFVACELPLVLPIMGPLLLRGLGQYSLNLVSMEYVNKHAPQHLAGVSLGMSLTTMLGWAAISGQSTALVTLTSQVHGAVSSTTDEDSRVDAYVNVALFVHVVWTIVPLLCLPILHYVLLSLGQPSGVVADSSLYFGLSILTLPPYAVFVAYRRFFDALLKPWPGAMLCGMGVAALWGILRFVGSLGVPAQHAPPMSLLLLFVIFAMVMVRVVGPVTGAWTMPPMRKLERYTSLAFPAMMSMMGQWWSTEVFVIAAARLDTASLAANAVCTSLMTFLYQVSFSASGSCSARVGYWLGAGHPKRAKQTIVLHALTAFVLSLLVAAPTIYFRSQVAAVLVGNQDAETVALTEMLIPLVCRFFILGAFQTIGFGALCGAGKQRISMWNTIAAYWFIGVPCAAYFGFVMEMGAVGFWHGLTIGLVLSVFLNTHYLAFRLDWDTLVDRDELVRDAQCAPLVESSESRRNSYGTLRPSPVPSLEPEM